MNTWVCQGINYKPNESTTHEAKIINDNLMQFYILFFSLDSVEK